MFSGDIIMKRSILIFLFIIIPVFSCFAGSFYSNIVIISQNSENLQSIISGLGITAYYIIKNGFCLLFEQKIDEQDTNYGQNLSKLISKEIDGIVLYTTNHDSDILLIYMYKNGSEIFSYDSNPGYFEGKEMEPKIFGIENILNEFIEINKVDLTNVLENEELFSDNIHLKFLKLLKFSGELINFCFFGYTIIEYDKDNIEKIEQKYNINIQKSQ